MLGPFFQHRITASLSGEKNKRRSLSGKDIGDGRYAVSSNPHIKKSIVNN
jgi:hypothetical protein